MSLAYFAQKSRVAAYSRERARSTGMVAGRKVWTEAERDVLRKFAPDYKAVRSRLRNRSKRAIHAQTLRLGLAKPIHIWSAAEISKLRKIFPSASMQEISDAFPHSTLRNIKNAAYYHGFRRMRVEYKPTGIPLLDAVRKRCFEIGWTLKDLDKAAKTKGYFHKAHWRGRHINYRALGRAIEALDGVVHAEWREYDD